jgi:hypothetical protein
VRTSPGGLIASILTVVVLFCLAGFQVTNETAGQRLLGRVGAALIELDRWLPAHHDDIELLSRDRPDAPLTLPDLPVDVTISPSAAIDASDESLRMVITRAMGEKLYSDGSGAVHDEEGKSHLGVAEPVRWTINLLGDSAHSFWRSALILTGLILLVLCAGLLWTRQSPVVAIAVGGGIAAAFSLIVWLIAEALQSVIDGAMDKEIALVMRDGAWLGLRNGLAVLAIGLAVAYLLSTIVPHREEWDDFENRDYPDYERPRRTDAPPY